MFEKSITALVKIAIVSPMDDFVVFPTLSFLDSFGISCHFLIAGFIYIASAYFFYCISIGTTSYSLVPNKYQAFVTQIFVFVQSLVSENVKENKGIKYFPIFFFLFLYIATLNVMGLASYTFAITCQLSVTICLSLTVFFSSCIYGFITHGKRFVAIFLPTGTPFLLSFLLIPVEIISFFF
jgi:F-type H+-transporting ATPase subunit a